MALARCFTVPAKNFLTGIFNRRHLHATAAKIGDDFTDLFPLGLRTSSVHLVRSDQKFDLTKGGVIGSGDAPGTPPFLSTEVIRAGVPSEHMLIMRLLHRYYPPLRRFAHELSAELVHPGQINAFVTPPGSQGVNLHFDVQDVLVLQIAGDKHWQFRAQPLVDPLPQQAWFDAPQRRREELRSISAPAGRSSYASQRHTDRSRG